MDGLSLALVVQADVAADDRNFQHPAGPRHSPDALLQLIVNFGTFRVAEIQAVGQGQRLRPHAGKVAANLGYGDLSSPVRVELAIPPVAVDGQRDSPAGALDPQHRSIVARSRYRVRLHLVVVLAVHVPLAGDVGGGQQAQQQRSRRFAGEGNVPQSQPLPVPVFPRWFPFQDIPGSFGEGSDGKIGHRAVPLGHPGVWRLGDAADF